MRVKEPISNTLLKIMAIIFKSHFKIYNTDDHLKTVYNKIIITDQLGFCELFVLINLADIKPIFLADEAIVHRYPFLFKSTKERITEADISGSMVNFVLSQSQEAPNFLSWSRITPPYLSVHSHA